MKTLVILLLSIITFNVYPQTSAISGKTGVYLKIGNEFPINFRYIIQRKSTEEKEWKVLAETNFPNSAAALKGRIMTAPAILRQGFKVSDTVVKVIWRRLNGALYTDSIKPYGAMPLYASALGVSYLDTSAKVGSYQYKVIKRDGNDIDLDSSIVKIDYSPVGLVDSLSPTRYEAADETVSISYYFAGKQNLSGVRVLRSRFGYNQFENIPVFTMFSKNKDSVIAKINDQTAAYKIAYQYIAIPFDELGNEGPPSDTLYVYNNSRAHDVGFFKVVKAVAKQKSILVSWRLSNHSDISAIKIFKSFSWDGNYVQVATSSPKDTSWADVNVQPMLTYYYRLQAQGPYSSSIASSRVQSLMKVPRKNIFPPQNLEAKIENNIVTLSFTKTDHDTRGYYVYRKLGFNGKPVQLRKMALSKDSLIVYRDTLKNIDKANIYTYNVASINTSYEIGPKSDGASITASGRIPIPTHVVCRFVQNKGMIFWDDMTKENQIAGYTVYRSEKPQGASNFGDKIKIADLLPFSNSFVDSTIIEGNHYAFYIACKGIGQEGTELGELSGISTLHYNLIRLLPPSNVVATVQPNGIGLSWNNPLGIPLTKIRIFRAQINEELKLLKELTPIEKGFTDLTVKKEGTYFYSFSIVDARGKESLKTEPLGVHY